MNQVVPRNNDDGCIIRVTDESPDGFLDDDYLEYPETDLGQYASSVLETKMEVDIPSLVVAAVGFGLGLVVWFKYFLP